MHKNNTENKDGDTTSTELKIYFTDNTSDNQELS